MSNAIFIFDHRDFKMTKTVLITGCSRGIGLEFVKVYAQSGWQVYAIVRESNPEFKKLLEKYSNIETITFDVTSFQEYEKLQRYFEFKAIDILINNAGIYGEKNQRIGNLNIDTLQQVFMTNTFAPILMVQTLLNAILRGSAKTIVNITSRMGSIAGNTSGKSYAYRSSKAALNAMMRSLQIDLQDKGVKVLVLHPGWVKTDMGGVDALIDTETSVKALYEVIEQAHKLPEMFYSYQKELLPW